MLLAKPILNQLHLNGIKYYNLSIYFSVLLNLCIQYGAEELVYCFLHVSVLIIFIAILLCRDSLHGGAESWADNITAVIMLKSKGNGFPCGEMSPNS